MHPTPPAWGTDFTTMNENEEDSPFYFRKMTLIVKLLTLIITLVGLAGNATVLWFLGLRMRRNAFSVYILNLAAADFLFLCCHIVDTLLYFAIIFYSVSIHTYGFFAPVWIFAYVAGLSMLSAISTERCLSVLWPIWYRCHRPRHTSAVVCALLWVLSLLLSILEGYHCDSSYGFFAPVWIFAYVAGLSMLSAISTERCLSVLWPIWYCCHRPRHTSAVVCALLWVLSLLLSILEGYHCDSSFKDFDYDWCQAFDFFTAAWLIFLFVVLSGSSLVLLARIFCSSRKRLMTRLYFTILLTGVVFLFCGLPLGIQGFLVTWIQTDFDIFLSYVLPVPSLLSSVNSCANPIIYFLIGSFRQRFRQQPTLRLVLQRALQDTHEEDEGGDSRSQEALEMSGSRVRQ